MQPPAGRYAARMHPPDEIDALIDRLTRLAAAWRRRADLDAAQVAALHYLGRANRFSRSPSAVAGFLATTRGTASQTLKALARKGLVQDEAVPGDGRARRYGLTAAGRSLVADRPAAPPWEDLPDADRDRLALALRALLAAAARQGLAGSFGMCRTCRHHARSPLGARCLLILCLRCENYTLVYMACQALKM